MQHPNAKLPQAGRWRMVVLVEARRYSLADAARTAGVAKSTAANARADEGRARGARGFGARNRLRWEEPEIRPALVGDLGDAGNRRSRTAQH